MRGIAARPSRWAIGYPAPPVGVHPTGLDESSMTTATLRIDDLPALGPTGRQVTIDCEHGATQVASVSTAGAGCGADGFLIKVVLIKHFYQQRCRCLHQLWRRHLGGKLGEVVLARGAAG